MPAFWYPIAAASRVECSDISLRSDSGIPGAGLSSMIFWCRRCRVQSRSPSATTVPSGSPKIWTSMCLGPTTACSTKQSGCPKALDASRHADSRALPSPASSVTIRSPRPPPPWIALMASG